MPTRPSSARSAVLKSKAAQRAAARAATAKRSSVKPAKTASSATECDAVSRILIAEDGRIAYASPYFAALLKTAPETLKGPNGP
jgi:hypothetical protein